VNIKKVSHSPEQFVHQRDSETSRIKETDQDTTGKHKFKKKAEWVILKSDKVDLWKEIIDKESF
jgi:hypothetical protein